MGQLYEKIGIRIGKGGNLILSGLLDMKSIMDMPKQHQFYKERLNIQLSREAGFLTREYVERLYFGWYNPDLDPNPIPQKKTNPFRIKSEIPNFSGTRINVTCELLEISNFLAYKFNNNELRNKTELVKLALSTKVLSDDTPAITYQKCRVIYGLKFPERMRRALTSK